MEDAHLLESFTMYEEIVQSVAGANQAKLAPMPYLQNTEDTRDNKARVGSSHSEPKCLT